MTADELRAAMKELDLSTFDVATLTGNTSRAIQFWLTGKNPVPRAAVLLLMAMRQGLITETWIIENLPV